MLSWFTSVLLAHWLTCFFLRLGTVRCGDGYSVVCVHIEGRCQTLVLDLVWCKDSSRTLLYHFHLGVFVLAHDGQLRAVGELHHHFITQVPHFAAVHHAIHAGEQTVGLRGYDPCNRMCSEEFLKPFVRSEEHTSELQ